MKEQGLLENILVSHCSPAWKGRGWFLVGNNRNKRRGYHVVCCRHKTAVHWRLKKKKFFWQETVPVRLHKERARAKGKQVALVHYDDDVECTFLFACSHLFHIFSEVFFCFCFFLKFTSFAGGQPSEDLCIFPSNTQEISLGSNEIIWIAFRRRGAVSPKTMGMNNFDMTDNPLWRIFFFFLWEFYLIALSILNG